jgi:hypothetical protein
MTGWHFDTSADRWEYRMPDGHVMGAVAGEVLSRATPQVRSDLVRWIGLPPEAKDVPPALSRAAGPQ